MPYTQIIAHRGAWKTAGLPQNSLAALRRAQELDCDGSEFDVHLTADGVAVVNHDVDFQGASIADSTYHELSPLRHPNGEPLPTLKEYLRVGRECPEMRLVLEIKPAPSGAQGTLAVAEKGLEVVQEVGAQAQVDYISFDYGALQAILARDSSARVAYLKGDKTPAQLKADGFYGADYNYRIFRAHPEWISELRENGLTLNAWTVDDITTMQWLLQAGADFITTDEPEQLRRLRDATPRHSESV